MKASTLLIVLQLHWCLCYWYPPLYWHKDYCGFQKVREMKGDSVTRELFLKVVQPFGLKIVCPNVFMNMWAENYMPDSSFYENFWSVNKEGYDKCEVSTNGDPEINKLLLQCDDKYKFKEKSFHFVEYQVEGFNFGPTFSLGSHHYFISTSAGQKRDLATRRKSGPNGSCNRHHMKLHIYVCNHTQEDCVYEPPKCGPPLELYRDMQRIGGTLPAPTDSPVPTTSFAGKLKPFHTPTDQPVPQSTTPEATPVGQKSPLCKKEDKGTSVQLILNFVLGGVALFMAVVIIILVCGLSNRNAGKGYEIERPPSVASSTHGAHFVNAEIFRYSDGHVQLSPVVISRTPPTSPNVIIQPYIPLQRMSSQRQSTPSDDAVMETIPPEETATETPLSNEVSAFQFPDSSRPVNSETPTGSSDSSESQPISVEASVTKPRHDDDELGT